MEARRSRFLKCFRKLDRRQPGASILESTKKAHTNVCAKIIFLLFSLYNFPKVSKPKASQGSTESQINFCLFRVCSVVQDIGNSFLQEWHASSLDPKNSNFLAYLRLFYPDTQNTVGLIRIARVALQLIASNVTFEFQPPKTTEIN